MNNNKFRAWHENSQTWVYFEFDKPLSLDAIKVHTQLCIEGKRFYQYIEKKDKNGKDIYDNDILIIDTISNKNRIVLYKKSCFWMGLKINNEIKAMYPVYEFESSELEVIGNRSENPNLI